jgi:6-phosphogluconolactonase (cycloisomerase 2 family)
VGTLVSFDLTGSGAFSFAPGAPYVLPSGDGGALGLAENPHAPVLYVGFPVASAVGVFSVDAASGVLTLVNKVSAGAAACWLRTNAAGTRLYVLNSGENTVGVYDITNATAPVFMSKLTLKGASAASGDFALSFSPSGNILYVVSQDINPAAGGDYNSLHSLTVGGDGSLQEVEEPLSLPVAADVRPMGVATR